MCFFDQSKGIEIASKSIAKARYVQRNMKKLQGTFLKTPDHPVYATQLETKEIL